MSLNYFRFFANNMRGVRVKICYGFGDIDDAIRYAAKLDTLFEEIEPFAGHSFEFESIRHDEGVLLEEGFGIECALLCSRDELNAYEEAA